MSSFSSPLPKPIDEFKYNIIQLLSSLKQQLLMSVSLSPAFPFSILLISTLYFFSSTYIGFYLIFIFQLHNWQFRSLINQIINIIILNQTFVQSIALCCIPTFYVLFFFPLGQKYFLISLGFVLYTMVIWEYVV